MPISPATNARNASGKPRSPSDFHAGDRVLYVPNHANGDTAHPDCESGVVTSTNSSTVFVRYGSELHSKATSPEDLGGLAMIRALIRMLRALPVALERGHLQWALREIDPMHRDVPSIVHRLNELERAK